MKRQDLDLVEIVWAEDVGLVSMKQGRWLCYAWGGIEAHAVADGIPTLEITDEDFKLLHDEPGNPEAFLEWANWDQVMALLKHPQFPLLDRIREHQAQRRDHK